MRFLFFVFLFACGVAPAKKAPIRLGYISGITGPFAGVVRRSLQAVELAIEEANLKGGVRGRPIELMMFDTKADPLQIAPVMEAADRSGVVAVLGFHMSNDALIAGPIAESKGLPMVVSGATHPGVTMGKRNVVRVCWSDEVQARKAVEFASKRLSAKRVVIVRDVADSYTLFLGDAFRRYSTRSGISIVADFAVRTGDRDFDAIVSSIAAMRPPPDLIYAPTSSSEAGYLIRQLSMSDVRVPLLGCDSWQNHDFHLTLSALGGVNLKTFFLGHWYRDFPAYASKNFVKRYESRFHDRLTSLDGGLALAYDAAGILITALRRAAIPDRKTLPALLREREFHGATGRFRIGLSGNPHKPVMVLEYAKGSVRLWQP